MLKQWELELLLDLVNDKMDEKKEGCWAEQLADVKKTLLNIEYEEDETL